MNKKLIKSLVTILLFILAGFFLIQDKNNKSSEHYLAERTITKDYFGPIPKSVINSQEPLKEIEKYIGKENIIPTKIYFAEGEEVSGYILFPNSIDSVDIIVEADSLYFRIPSWDGKERKTINWKTEEGITLGTSLNDVEKLNVVPFGIAGYEWDYSGSTLGWKNGKLSEDLHLVFKLMKEPENDSDYRKISGDSDIGSSNAVLKNLNPIVAQMSIYWIRNSDEKP